MPFLQMVCVLTFTVLTYLIYLIIVSLINEQNI